MSLVGSLEDLGMGEILQILSLSRKSGVLQIHSRGRHGKVVFRFGQVIQATCSTFQENLGEALIRKGVLDLRTLRNALARQEREGFRERLGMLLVREFEVSADAVETVVREQIERVVYALFAWVEGSFDFELQDDAGTNDGIRMDPMQFMLEQGLNPQFLAMEGSRIVDERRHRGESAGEPDPLQEQVRTPLEDGAGDALLGSRQEWEAEELPVFRSEPELPVQQPSPLVLVDDDEPTRQALTEHLAAAGYRVFATGRSEDGLIEIDTLCRAGMRPAILVDLIMPRMDGTGILGGLELLEMLHAKFPDLPVVVLSDYHTTDAERQVGELGYRLVGKPFIIAAFVACRSRLRFRSPKSRPQSHQPEIARGVAASPFCSRFRINLAEDFVPWPL